MGYYYGNSTNETIEGSETNDTLLGEGGRDIIYGFGGNDYIDGGSGSDTIDAGAGNDTILGGAGADSIDGGEGWDTVYYWSAPGGVEVNLNAGTASGEGSDTLVNIEAAVGTYLDDVLIGDAGMNMLDGQEGNDVLSGRGGDDMLRVGAGDLQVDGGSGSDMLSFYGLGGQSNSTTGVVFSLEGDAQQNTGHGTIAWSNIEHLEGTNFDDILFGNDEANMIIGGGGDDHVDGGAGNDTLLGDGQAFIDTEDMLINYSVWGEVSSGNDTIYGGRGHDTIFGGQGEDQIYGNEGNDNIEGGDGNDEIYGGDKADTIYGGADDDLIVGNSGSDQLMGDDGNDTIKGNSGGDVLLGNAGDDVMQGHKGDDYLQGGTGNDTMSGNLGNDTFFFEAEDGADVILDFEVGADTIEFSWNMELSFESLVMTDVDGGVEISWGSDDSITLEGLAAADLSESDFEFNDFASLASAGEPVALADMAMDAMAIEAGFAF